MQGAEPASRQPLDVIGRRVDPGVDPGTVAHDDFTYFVVEPKPGERRGEQRARTRLRDGLVGERRGHVLVECRIRDRSRRGARLQLDRERPLPKAFFLMDAGTRARFRAILVWQVGRDAGVRLLPAD